MHDIRTNELSRVFRQILIENLDRWCIVNDIDWKFGSMMYCEWYWLKIWIDDYYEWYCKPGGLDVSRRRFSNCRDFLDSQDVGFRTVEIESLDRDYVKNRDFKARRFLNCRDFFDSWDVVFELSIPKVLIETPRPMVLSVNLQKAYSKCNIWLFLFRYFPSSDWISSCRQKWLNFFYSNN